MRRLAGTNWALRGCAPFATKDRSSCVGQRSGERPAPRRWRSPSMPLEIRIPTDAKLIDLETCLDQIASAPSGTNFSLTLPRNITGRICGPSWVVAVLLTAARRGAVKINDTHHLWDPAETERYLQSLEPLAALTYATEFVNTRGEPCPLPPATRWQQIGEAGGVLEPQSEPGTTDVLGKSLTIAALDPHLPEPGIFAGYTSKKDVFIKWLQRLRLLRTFLSQLPPLEIVPGRPGVTAQYRLAEYIYEAYSNTYEHANKTHDNRTIPGLRYIRLRKHIATSGSRVLEYADGFPALATYLQRIAASAQPTTLFCEIAVGDQGIGIIDHFVQACPQWSAAANDPAQRLGVLRMILRKSLSSKRTIKGAGGGLQNVAAACEALRAFVTIRTDRYWLFSSYPGDETPKVWEEATPGRALAPVSGVHFSCLIPLAGR